MIIRHLKGRPCRQPEKPHLIELTTKRLEMVNCPFCRITRKFQRLTRETAI